MKSLRNLFIVFVLLSSNCFAQLIPIEEDPRPETTEYSRELLTSVNWIIDGSDHHIYKLSFSDTKLAVYNDDELTGEQEYYLASTSFGCTTGIFIENNVGNVLKGKYIITTGGCIEIISLTDSKLEYRSVPNGNYMTASPE